MVFCFQNCLFIGRFGDNKGIIRICKSKDRQHHGQKKRTDNTRAKRKGQTIQWPKEKRQKDKQQSRKYYTEN